MSTRYGNGGGLGIPLHSRNQIIYSLVWWYRNQTSGTGTSMDAFYARATNHTQSIITQLIEVTLLMRGSAIIICTYVNLMFLLTPISLLIHSFTSVRGGVTRFPIAQLG